MFRLRSWSFLLPFILTVAVGACADKASPVPTAPTAVAASGAASLSPSSMGSGQMVERPLRLTGHSEAVMTLSDTCVPTSQYFPVGCQFQGHGEGVASHFGKFTLSATGTLPITSTTIVTANGDVLTAEGNEVTGLATITGGTGRFAGATGSFTGVETPAGPPTIEGGVVKIPFTWTFEGTITY